jgi:hypothetical protein
VLPSLDAVVEALEELLPHAPEARAPRGNQLLIFNYARLECQLLVFSGPQPSQEDVDHLSFCTSVLTQLAGGEPIFSVYLARNTLIAFLFGLHDTAGTIGHLVA